MRKSIITLTIIFILLALGIIAYYILFSPVSGGGSIEVVDALGRTVKIKTSIKRVIIAGRGAWPIMTAAYMFPNARKVLYGLSESLNVTLFRVIDPNLSAKIVPGIAVASPNIDEIAKAGPDVVILKSTMKALGDQLEELGISVLYVDLENLESYLRDLRVLGKVFMDEKRGEELARYYSEKVNSVILKIPLQVERPKALFLYYSVKGGEIAFNVPGSGWLQIFMMEAAGGYPLSKEVPGTGWNTVTFEQIARWAPDIIFIVTYSNKPSASEAKGRLLKDDMWANIPAIRSGRVYAVPDDCNVAALGSWDTPGSRWILGLLWMAKKMHPSIFQNLDIEEEARRFYMEIYGLSKSDADMVIGQITGDFP